MEDNVEPYSFDLNLDFLDSTTTSIKNVPIRQQYQGQSQICSTYDIESLAGRIATVNDLVIQVKATKDDNLRLQKQMQDLSESALSIRAMYDQEKADKLNYKKLYEDWKEKYELAESRLANKTLHFDQIQSKMELEAEDKKPLTYCELALKYQRLASYHEEDKQLPSKEKAVVQLVKEYLEGKKLSPLPVFKKKSPCRVKFETRDFSMQCHLKLESKSQETQCSFGYSEEEAKDTCTQGTQYTWYTTTRGTNTPAFNNPKPEVKTQGTQYISSTTTRGTSTSTFIKTQSIGTNFPEPVPPVSIEDIFEEMICNVSPLSPMSSNSAELKEEQIEMKSIGTCTDLKNVRKSIDYVAANIKHSDSRPPSRNNNLFDRVKNEIPFIGMPTLNPFAGLGNPVTPMHNTVAELWNMLGHTIFALLQQNSGAGVAAAAQINPMHMNILNDRMKNLNGRNRPPSELQKNCESEPTIDFFEQEYRGEYLTTTRSTATSPILPSELENSQPPVRPSFEATTRGPYQQIDIKKIFLNKNFSDSVVSSSKKSSQVDEILKLFPEYSDSFKKRKAIKRLLKETNKYTKSKKKRNSNSSSSSASISTQFSTEERKTNCSLSPVSASPQLSAKAISKIFGESNSDSSLDDSVSDYIKSEEKWTPIEAKLPSIQIERPISSLSYEIKRPKIKSFIEKEYFGFHKDTNDPKTSNELCFKTSLSTNVQNLVMLSDTSTQNTLSCEMNNSELLSDKKIKLKDKIENTNLPNTKRKRKTKKSDSNPKTKIYKIDEAETNSKQKSPPEIKKPKRSLSLDKNKIKDESILKTQPSYDPLSYDIQNQPSEDNNNTIKNKEKKVVPSVLEKRNNHGPKVMKVEKPPDSIFQDIKNCFIHPKPKADTKPCIGPIMPILSPTEENILLPVKSIPLITPTEDGSFRFLIKNSESSINANNYIQNSDNSLKILNCHQNPEPDISLKSSVTILNEELFTQLHGLKTIERECSLIASTPQDSLSLDKKKLDLENIPIYFLDDQNVLQHSDESNELKLNFESKQKAGFTCQNLEILPRFEDIERASSSCGIQGEELPKPTQSQLEDSSVKDNSYPSHFEENHRTINLIEAMPIPAESNSKASSCQENTSCLELKYQTQLLVNKEISISTKKEKEEEVHITKNGTVNLKSLSQPDINLTDPFISSNRQKFDSTLILGSPQRERIPQDADKKNSTVLGMQYSKVGENFNKSLEKTNFKSQVNKFDGNCITTTNENKDLSLKSPNLITTANKYDISSASSSDEGDLSIDCPPSPQPTDSSCLDMSAVLKTPKADNCEVTFKTPDIFSQNDSLISKAVTNSTEKLVEEYFLNETPGEEGPKFQVFLDRILDDVAPPTSPISALASSEKLNHSETESSCDEAISGRATPIKYKKKVAATAAIAVKRSARINAKKIDTTTNMKNSLYSMTIPNIELGKYTKRKANKQPKKQEKLNKTLNEEKIDIKMGFFRDTMDEEDKEPTCELIRHHFEKDFINVPQHFSKEFSLSEKLGQTSPEKEDTYLSLYKKVKPSLSLNLKKDEANNFPVPDSSIDSVCRNFKDSLPLSYESPTSPPPPEQLANPTHTIRESFEVTPISSQRTIISHLIATYKQKFHNISDKDQSFNKSLVGQVKNRVKEFLNGECQMIDIIQLIDDIIKITSNDKIICKALVNVLKEAPRPETEVDGKIPDTYLSQTHRKLLNVVRQLYYHYSNLHSNLQTAIEQAMFTLTQEVISIEVLLNLTQFYLAIIRNNPSSSTNPARLFICKCLYFYNIKAIPLIYHTLCVYPTVLPQKMDPTYDRSDILISTIQSILMSTYYDPEKFDLMSKQIVTKLHVFYNYENFKPPRDEVIENMIAKIKAGRFKNVSYALSVICKRMDQSQAEKFILIQRLMPLANEYYHTFAQSNENDEKIACVLECISFVIKPFNVNTDISQYVNLFVRFMNAAPDRKVVQEAAVAAILRTARFGYVQCFNAIYNFNPTYELSDTLKLMLRSFVYKRGLDFLRALERQAQQLLTA